LEKSSATLQLLRSTGHTLSERGPVTNLTASILHAPTVNLHEEESLTGRPEQANYRLGAFPVQVSDPVYRTKIS